MRREKKFNRVMLGVFFIFLAVFSLALTIGSQTTARWLVVLAQTDESLTITTYYPSPMGVYSELQLFPRDAAAGTCAAANDEGKMFYDLATHGLFVCQDVNNVISWQPVGGANFWAANGNNIYNTNSGRVGIGDQNAGYNLSINGSLAATGLIRFTSGSPAEGKFFMSTDSAGRATWKSCSICIDCDPDGGNVDGPAQCVSVGQGWSDWTGDLNANDSSPGSDNVRCKISMSCS